MSSTWRVTAMLLRGHLLRLGCIGAASVSTGLAQTVVLVIIVRTSLALSRGQDDVGLGIGHSDFLNVSVPVALSIAGALVMLLIAATLLSARLCAAIGTSILIDRRARLLDDFLRADLRTQHANGAGAFVELLGQSTMKAAQVGLATATAVVATLNVAVLLVSAVIISPIAAAAIIVGVAALSYIAQPLARRRRLLARQQADADLVFATAMHETYQAAREIRLYSANTAFSKHATRISDDVARPFSGMIVLNRFTPPAFQYAGFGMLVAALAILSRFNGTRMDELGTVLLLLLRSFAYVQSFQVSLQSIGQSAPYIAKIDAEVARLQPVIKNDGGERLSAITSLELRNGWFAYPGRDPVLQGIDLRICQGEALGIVGASGCGKSTLVLVLMRLLDLDAGQLFVNGIPVSEFSVADWYKRVALVTQDPRLINGTVTENISFFREEIDAPRVKESARLAGIHEEIVDFPHGYDTRLSFGGSGLSGGQMQRICLARALAGAPDVLVLDEPTSALDANSRARVLETLSRLKRRVTIVVVAHQPEVVASCDRVIRLGSGHISDVPRFADLHE